MRSNSMDRSGCMGIWAGAIFVDFLLIFIHFRWFFSQMFTRFLLISFSMNFIDWTLICAGSVVIFDDFRRFPLICLNFCHRKQIIALENRRFRSSMPSQQSLNRSSLFSTHPICTHNRNNRFVSDKQHRQTKANFQKIIKRTSLSAQSVQLSR